MDLIFKATIVIFSIIPWIKIFLSNKKQLKSLEDLDAKYNPDTFQFKMILVSQLSEKNCGYHLYRRTSCGSECSHEHLEKIKNYVRSAKSSVNIMMYHLTIESLANVIIECATKRNIKIRCICDHDMGKTEASKYKDFLQYDIKVRAPNQGGQFMHHKVILVDADLPYNQGKVLTGSMNMTIQALTKNWDMFVITNSKDVVSKFNDEFEYLWEHFSPFMV